MRRYYKCTAACLILINLSWVRYAYPSAGQKLPDRHLIPTPHETEAIGRLDFDSDGIINRDDPDIDGDRIPNNTDADIDGDGVKNDADPAPGDRREIGYHPFGMLAFLSWNHPWNNFKYTQDHIARAVRMIKKTGASFVRMDFYWNDIEPAPGRFSFEPYDRIGEELTRNNIGILAILDYSADWTAPRWNSPPRRDEDFVAFCRKVANRYKHRIKYWEIWNEPDSPAYWHPQDGMKRYTRLLKKSAAGIKEADASVHIVLGGLTAQGYYALNRIYSQGGKDAFDIVNIHPFVDPLTPNALDRIRNLHENIRRLMRRYGDQDKKIWFTEIGCPGVESPDESNAWWEGVSPSETEQAHFLYRVYTELLTLEGVEKIFWAYLRDNKDHFRSGMDYFGLIRWDFSPKKSYNAYRKAFRHWQKKK